MKRDVKVEVVPITDLQPDPNNANAGTERGLAMLEDSLQTLGAGRSVLADKHGVLMAGNKTHQRAVELGFQEAVVVHTNGRQLVVVQRDDLDLETDPRARRMAISDNRVGEIDLQWSAEMLAAIAERQPEAVAGLWTPEEMAAVLAAGPFGDTATSREGQGVSSTWDQVHTTDNCRVIIGEIETHLPADVVASLTALLETCYDHDGTPIYETLEAVIVAGVRAVETSGD